MTVQHLRNVQQAVPFRPFTVHMADGRSFLVRHPDFLSIAPAGRTVIVYGDGEDFQILDVMLMTGIETSSAPAPRS